jgi:hypothetical protein
MHVKMAEAKALAETKTCARIPPIQKQVAEVFPESVADIEAIAKSCTQ